jgi:hypothetical protein
VAASVPFRRILLAALAVAAFATIGSRSASAIPPLLNYQGYLADNVGQPLTGPHTLRFDMFADSTGGASLWSESYAGVAVNSGVFNVLLGGATPIPIGSLLTGATRWLQTTVDGAPMLPRQPIVSVAYALRSELSEMRVIARGVGYNQDGTDNGILAGRSVQFTKKYPETGLRVAWSDNFRVLGPNQACRWQVLFNGAPCANPGPIVFDLYESSAGYSHSPGSVFGTCMGLPAGPILVTTQVAPAPGYGVADCYTGWQSGYFQIEVEEVR